MRSDPRAIKAVLREEAARAPIPQGMWVNISQRLDDEMEARERVRRAGRRRLPALRHALAFAVVAGFFGYTFVPVSAPPKRAAPPQQIVYPRVDPSLQDIPVDFRPGPRPQSHPNRIFVAGAGAQPGFRLGSSLQ